MKNISCERQQLISQHTICLRYNKADYNVHKESATITFMQIYKEKTKQRAEQPELCFVP